MSNIIHHWSRAFKIKILMLGLVQMCKSIPLLFLKMLPNLLRQIGRKRYWCHLLNGQLKQFPLATGPCKGVTILTVLLFLTVLTIRYIDILNVIITYIENSIPIQAPKWIPLLIGLILISLTKFFFFEIYIQSD